MASMKRSGDVYTYLAPVPLDEEIHVVAAFDHYDCGENVRLATIDGEEAARVFEEAIADTREYTDVSWTVWCWGAPQRRVLVRTDPDYVDDNEGWWQR